MAAPRPPPIRVTPTPASDINNLGDIGYGESGAGLHLDGQGIYALWSFLDPAAVAAGWTITGNGSKINDQRMVATVGRNSNIGQSGGVLLTPVGTLPPPTVPSNLRGVAYTATRMEPYNSIDLMWENTCLLTGSYELGRREMGSARWIKLSLTRPEVCCRAASQSSVQLHTADALPRSESGKDPDGKAESGKDT